jgi:hypothetical protein
MKRRRKTFTWALATTIVLFLGSAVYDYITGEIRESREPILYSSYPEAVSDNGYYEFDTAQILQLLDDGRMDVFSRTLEDPALSEESLDDLSIAWTQSEYLRIASAAGKSAWDDDLKEWRMYRLYFQQSCEDDFSGFDSASLVYFNDDDSPNSFMYSTRIIEIFPYFSGLRWGGGVYYPKPFLQRWKSIDLSRMRFTAEEALQVAEENGGKAARLQEDNSCIIIIDSEANNKWEVEYFGAGFEVLVDMYTGKVKVLKSRQ